MSLYERGQEVGIRITVDDPYGRVVADPPPALFSATGHEVVPAAAPVG